MPELPEVQTIVGDLLPHLTGRTITDVRLAWPKAVAAPDVEGFVLGLRGQRIVGMERRGKYIALALESGRYLVLHLKMTGALLWRQASDPPDRFTRTVFALDGGHELRFTDIRKFGRLWLVDDLAQALPALGPEPLDGAFTAERLAQALKGRRAPIKACLCDQKVVAGVGNIYADEALFLAGVHPLRRADGLRRAEVARLRDSIVTVLEQGIRNRGTSFDTYRDGHGNKGSNQLAVRVYQRDGEPCPRCGTAIRRTVVGQRSAHFCPNCQPRRPLKRGLAAP